MKHEDEKLEAEARRIEQREPSLNSQLEAILNAIPQDVPLASLGKNLTPLWDALTKEDDFTARLFISENVRKHFGLQKTDCKQFIKEYRRIRRIKEKTKRTEAEKTVLLDRDINSPEAIDAISRIGLIDRNMFDLVTAAVISAKLRTNPPIWILLIGPPSSFKTELVGLIDLPEIFSLDSLSENAFSSGYVMPDGSEPNDLLPLLDGKCFVIKDLTTLFSLKEDTVKKILGDLTSIFDGKFEKFTATRGAVRYRSQFSVIACITPAILGKHHRYMHQLGGRFFFVRVPELTDQARLRGYEIAWDATNRDVKIKEARQIVSTYCAQALDRAIALYNSIEQESIDIQSWLNAAADFIAHARGTTFTRHVSFENEENKKIDYYEVTDPQIEQPWRILNQLKTLARILAAIRSKTQITISELETLKPLLLSSMPTDRSVIISELVKEDKLLVREVAERINKSTKTAGRDLKELVCLGLVIKQEINDPKTGKDAAGYSLKPEYKELLVGLPLVNVLDTLSSLPTNGEANAPSLSTSPLDNLNQ